MPFLHSIRELVETVFSKLFLRTFIFFIIFIYVSGFFPWTKAIYDYLFPYPELRIMYLHTSVISPPNFTNDSWHQQVASIENRGNDTANDVFVSATIPWGEITRFEIFSTYPHVVHPNTNLSDGYLLIHVDSLAAGAEILLYLWGRQNADTQNSQISLNAIHNKGSAPNSLTLSSSEQIGHLAGNALNNLAYSIDFIEEVLKKRQAIIRLDDVTSVIPIPSLPTYLLFTAFVISFLVWLFLSTTKSAIIHGIVTSCIYWLRVDNFFVDPYIVIATSTLNLFYVYIRHRNFVTLNEKGVTTSNPYTSESREKSDRNNRMSDQNWCRLNLSGIICVSGFLLLLMSAMGFEFLSIGSGFHMLISYILVGYIIVMIFLFL